MAFKEKDILWEGAQGYWVLRVKVDNYEVLKNGATAAQVLEAYSRADLAIARAKYLDARGAKCL